ncbi:MAG: DUF2442 domain-containing protein [Bacteroidetes bacterium]|jgi:hypothetical protein|nr:DUF2442 domain-containing protein [Bacteroidota bacterium]MBT6686333.1 DUF2442 domain-containing protein [Bacteroidota bacterium]MBT7142166.1 DUF2442 domain-containing protein [Bacteroidota bacterium]MBT7490479.1 DUF2442 domain-containing protein [Bacteroidota bacterium]
MYKTYAINNVEVTNDLLILMIDSKEYRFKLKEISEPLSNATIDEKSEFIVSPSGYGIHWPRIDEDISIHALLMKK